MPEVVKYKIALDTLFTAFLPLFVSSPCPYIEKPHQDFDPGGVLKLDEIKHFFYAE